MQTHREREQLLRYLSAVFEARTADDLLIHLRELDVAPPYRLRLKVLFSKTDIRSALTPRRPSPDFVLSEAGLVSFTIRRRIGEQRKLISARCALLPTSSPDIHVAVSVATHDEWVQLTRLFRDRYPAIVPIYLSQSELIGTVQILSRRAHNLDVSVRELTAREKLPADASKRLKSVREWTDESIQSVLEATADRGQSIASITLGFYKRAGDSANPVPATLCKITNDAQLEVTGRFSLAWDTAIPRIAAIGSAKLNSYLHRGMRELNYKAAPLEIRFKTGALDSPESIRQFVDILGRYPHSMRSVHHGNPYAHVRVADLLDGSSFDIWSLDGRSVAIVPQLKGSEAAINRLIHYIFFRFREGDVRNYAVG